MERDKGTLLSPKMQQPLYERPRCARLRGSKVDDNHVRNRPEPSGNKDYIEGMEIVKRVVNYTIKPSSSL